MSQPNPVPYLTAVGPKQRFLYVKQLGNGEHPLVFVHGLSATHEFFRPLIDAAGFAETHKLYLYDFEGHGLSPVNSTAEPSLQDHVEDLLGIFQKFGLKRATIIAHSMGCMIAEAFATQHASLIDKMVLLGPLPYPLPPGGKEMMHKRAATVREAGLVVVADAVAEAGTAAETKSKSPLATSLVRLSTLSQSSEGYARASIALGNCDVNINPGEFLFETLIVVGADDKVAPPVAAENLAVKIRRVQKQVLPGIGHWYVYEDVHVVSKVVLDFIAKPRL
jgi:pimeloyl-ACP methyl ester carboxylesterase